MEQSYVRVLLSLEPITVMLLAGQLGPCLLYTSIEGIFKVQKINERNYRLWFSGGRDVAKDIVKCSVNKGWELEEIHFEKSSLDAVFAKLSNKEIRE